MVPGFYTFQLAIYSAGTRRRIHALTDPPFSLWLMSDDERLIEDRDSDSWLRENGGVAGHSKSKEDVNLLPSLAHSLTQVEVSMHTSVLLASPVTTCQLVFYCLVSCCSCCSCIRCWCCCTCVDVQHGSSAHDQNAKDRNVIRFPGNRHDM